MSACYSQSENRGHASTHTSAFDSNKPQSQVVPAMHFSSFGVF